VSYHPVEPDNPRVGPDDGLDPSLTYLIDTYHIGRAEAAYRMTVEGAALELGKCDQLKDDDSFAGLWLDEFRPPGQLKGG
jgi:hypothetical protein